MATTDIAPAPSFRDLVLSDLARFRPDRPAGWMSVVLQCATTPGMIASLVVRAQQCLFRAGHVRLAGAFRTLGTVLVGADFGPGMRIGTGLQLAHPVGVNIGYGLVIGDNVTLAAGVTAAARDYDDRAEQEFATICDGAILGAHAVLVGGVRVGRNAVVGANSVVLSDVPDDAVVMGVPARRVGTRPGAEPGADSAVDSAVDSAADRPGS